MTKAELKKSDPKPKQNVDVDQGVGHTNDREPQIPSDENIEAGQSKPDNLLQQMLHGDESTEGSEQPDMAGMVGFNDRPTGYGQRTTDETRELDTE